MTKPQSIVVPKDAMDNSAGLGGSGSRGAHRFRSVGLGIAALVASLVMGTVSAEPASAHAEIVTMTPTAGQLLKMSPKNIVMTFNEPVTSKVGGIQLVDAKGKLLKKGAAATDSTFSISLPKLSKGYYVIRWSVTSADGHQIIGASAFSVSIATAKTNAIAVNASVGGVIGTLSGDRPGVRSFTYNGSAIEGTVEFRSRIFGATISVPLVSRGDTMTASVMLPAAGQWYVQTRVKVSQFDELIKSGTVTLRP